MWQGLFAVAAFFNIAVATAMLAAPDRMAGHLSLSGPGAPYVIVALGVFVGVFGIGYAIVARNPMQNRGIVWIGMLGKIGVALLGAMQFAAQTIQFRSFALGMGDLVFAVLFGLFLWRMRPAQSRADGHGRPHHA